MDEEEKFVICEYCGRTMGEGEKLKRCKTCGKMHCSYHTKPREHDCEGVDWEEIEKQRESERKKLVREYDMKSRLKDAGSAIFSIILTLVVLYAILVYLPPAIPGIIESLNSFFREGYETIESERVKNDIDIGRYIYGEPEPQEIEQLVFQYTNEERTKYGLPSLSYDSRLELAARWQSECVFENESACGTVEERYTNFSIKNAGGENIYEGKDAPSYDQDGEPTRYYSEDEIARKAVSWFMVVSKDKENVLDREYTHMGVGVYISEDHDVIVVQDFMIEESCGWKGEPCCQEDENYFCHSPWSCDTEFECY